MEGMINVSILIKMEMPKRCFDCPVYDVSAVFCKALDKWVDDGEIETERHKDCPLIEVPPHGDLIDRDVLIEEWDNGLMDDAPTIIEAEGK